jgi:hypothetical protein
MGMKRNAYKTKSYKLRFNAYHHRQLVIQYIQGLLLMQSHKVTSHFVLSTTYIQNKCSQNNNIIAYYKNLPPDWLLHLYDVFKFQISFCIHLLQPIGSHEGV